MKENIGQEELVNMKPHGGEKMGSFNMLGYEKQLISYLGYPITDNTS